MAQMIMAVFEAAYLGERRDRMREASKEYFGGKMSFNPLLFTLKLFLMRLVTDLIFWAGHIAMHKTKKFSSVHKKHHQDVHPTVYSNVHFSVPDFMIEAIIPFQGAFHLVQMVHPKLLFVDVFEERLLYAYILFTEGLAHAAKPVPTSSLAAPIAP